MDRLEGGKVSRVVATQEIFKKVNELVEGYNRLGETLEEISGYWSRLQIKYNEIIKRIKLLENASKVD